MDKIRESIKYNSLINSILRGSSSKDRSIVGDNDGIAVVDIGAFEFDPRITSLNKSKDKSYFSPGPENRKAKGLWLIHRKIIDYRVEVSSFFYP